jgi:hypothetical protein
MLKSLYRFLSPKFQTLFLEYPVRFEPRYGHGKPPHSLLQEIIHAHYNDYAARLEGFLQHKEQFWRIEPQPHPSDDRIPHWNNGYLPGLDIIGIYGMLASLKPHKYVEIGSGNSTKVAYKAIQEQQLATTITCIDPKPRANISHLANHILQVPFEQLDASFLTQLSKGDILFIDNSHRVLPNSDAMVFFMEVLPNLQPGVVVHIHDVYLPYDYPPFMCERFYSEQYFLAAFLMANPKKYKVLLPNYFISEDLNLRAIVAPIWEHPNLSAVERHGGSFWFEIMTGC